MASLSRANAGGHHRGTTARLTLINARPSPYGRKVAIALLEKGLAHDVIYDVPWGPDSCTGVYSPFHQLPILLPESGPAIYDSTYILEWLEQHYPHPALVSKDRDEWLNAKLRQTLGERLMEFCQALIFEHHRPEPSPAWIERQTVKIEATLAELNRLYGELMTKIRDAIDVGDIAVGATLLVLEYVVPAGLSPDISAFRWRTAHPNLALLVGQLERRQSFCATVPQAMHIDIGAAVR